MRNRILRPLAVSALVISFVPVAATAQQAANNQPAQPSTDKPVATLKVQAREVLLPVTVRDKHGALVASLDKGDFALTEDGRPQTIKSFTHESNLPYKLGLLIDTSRSVSGALEHERKAGEQFVDAMLPAEPRAKDPDQAFLIHFDRQVELLEDFTTSRDKLHHELDEMSASRERRDDSQGPETTGDDRERPSARRGGTQLYDAIFLASDDLMKHQDGRKALVVFSDGVDRGSKDTMNDAVDAADRANVAVYTIYFKGQEEHASNFGYPGGGHHGGYPGGGYPGGGGYPSGGGYPGGGHHGGGEKPAVDGKKIMQEIATRTGGHAYEAKKREDLDAIYKLIAEELRGQYLLTYTPDKVDNDGGYHKIALKPTKGDLQVSTREGYYAPGGDESK
ncbi:MAG TPA: VWA domain-containing protein [Terriglobales bacterium]|nr:VWA domain-containing protein [Terriglobales bacterium]